MSQYHRLRVPGATLFFTLSLVERGSDLLIDQIDRLRWAVATTRRERPFTIDAFVVLPDHLHCIWTLPERDADYSTRWRLIKSRFSMGLPAGRLRPSHRSRSERGLWQPRFWEHHVRDEADYRDHLRFCWGDPVRHGLVARAGDWPFSSIHRDTRIPVTP